MPSLLLTSDDFDNPERIAADLSPPAGSFAPDLGFFFCDSQIPVEETLALVQNHTPCPIVRGTSLALPYKKPARTAARAFCCLRKKR